MKINNIITTFLLFGVMFTGCSVKEDGIYGSFPYIEVEDAAVTVSKVSHSMDLPYSSNRDITASVKDGDGWLTAQVGDGKVILEFTDNELETTRTATLTLATPNSLVKKEIVITQDASGELTFQGDLILHSKEEIANNTYTKTAGSLIAGNVILTKTEEVTTDFEGMMLTVAESDIDDSDLETLTEQIHMVKNGALAIVNTKVTTLPVELVKANSIDKVYFVANDMTVLPEASVMEDLGLTELSLKGNHINDISSITGCNTISYLNIADTDITDLTCISVMPSLEKVDISGLSVSIPQLDVFIERFKGTYTADNIDTEAAAVPIIDEIEVTELADDKIQIKARVIRNGGDISKSGFYIGQKRLIDAMTFYPAEITSDGTITLEYTSTDLHNKIHYFRASATNGHGEGFSHAGNFGSLTAYGDVRLSTKQELEQFYNDSYSHINGSVYVGCGTNRLNISELKFLSNLVYVRDGLYIENTDISDITPVAHITGMTTLSIKNNNIRKIPELKCAETLKELNVSRNYIEDFDFMTTLPNVERLHLGDVQNPMEETNDIGVLTGLENHDGLRYIDLSGLPLHHFQAEDLRELMPECEIIFTSGNRIPHLPTVQSGTVKRNNASATLRGYVSNKGRSDIIEHGFYFGKDKTQLTRYKVGDAIDENTTFTLDIDISDEDTYYFYTYAANSQGESRNAIKAFTLAYEDLSNYGTANCYMIHDSGKYRFDCRVKGCSSESLGTPAYVEVLWESKHTYSPYTDGAIINSVELLDGFIEFEATGVEGNAVIAVKDAGGTVLWSWHIWVTDEPSTHLYSLGNGDYVTMMDRNVGATRNDKGNEDEWKESIGTLYQWGRKDPFLYETGRNITGQFTAVDESVRNPMAYPSMNDWSANMTTDLWSKESKTIYDPCPPGYTVADQSVFSALTPSGIFDNGINFLYDGVNTAWFSAVPYIDCFGASCWASTYGYIWTSETPSSLNPYVYYYDAYEHTINNYRSNGDAYPVRCRLMGEAFAISTVSVASSETDIMATGKITLNIATVIQEAGFIYSRTDTNPTLASNEGKVTVPEYAGGEYSCSISGLKANTLYHVRAFATFNGTTAYGRTISISTQSPGIGEGFTGDDFEW